MAEVRDYKKRDYVRAELIETDSQVGTRDGMRGAKAGDYLVYESAGTRVVKGSVFNAEFVLVESEESEARQFSPGGKSVEEVLEFLKENPDEVERVKQLERDGGSRKGILNYEKR